MDKDRVKVILKEAIQKLFDEDVLQERTFYVGEDTVNLMAEASLNVFLAIEDVQNYLKKEGLVGND